MPPEKDIVFTVIFHANKGKGKTEKGCNLTLESQKRLKNVLVHAQLQLTCSKHSIIDNRSFVQEIIVITYLLFCSKGITFFS